MGLVRNKNNRENYLTIADLKKIIKNMDDSDHVFYQRIEDIYFEPGKGWKENSVFKRDVFVRNDEYNPEDPNHHDQFVEVFSALKYDEEKNLYLSAHY